MATDWSGVAHWVNAVPAEGVEMAMARVGGAPLGALGIAQPGRRL
jgi:hypothetical protein